MDEFAHSFRVDSVSCWAATVETQKKLAKMAEKSNAFFFNRLFIMGIVIDTVYSVT